jgi:hypothetical protein
MADIGTPPIQRTFVHALILEIIQGRRKNKDRIISSMESFTLCQGLGAIGTCSGQWSYFIKEAPKLEAGHSKHSLPTKQFC